MGQTDDTTAGILRCKIETGHSIDPAFRSTEPPASWLRQFPRSLAFRCPVAATLQAFGKSLGDLDVTALIKSLHEQTEAVNRNDLGRSETMLTAQAHTLDAIFNNLARRAVNAEYMDHLDRYLKLALRAQSQCRATWETLSTIKNPPMVGYVKQANIAHGHQQVNNGSPEPSNASRAGENPNLQNELLEAKDGERLDTGTTGTAGGADPSLETVEAVDGTKDNQR